LLAFFTATNGPNWSNNDGWGENNDICAWYGLSCANTHVTGLYLSNNQLRGSLPPELASLSNVRYLYLANNELDTNVTDAALLAWLDSRTYHDDWRDQRVPPTATPTATSTPDATSTPTSTPTSTLSLIAIEAVELDGIREGYADTDYTFTAVVSPSNATLPITYTWAATGQPEQTQILTTTTATLSYTWSLTGTNQMRVQATNAVGSVASPIVNIAIVSRPITTPTQLTLTAPTIAYTDTVVTLTATLAPRATLTPITYTWSADGQAPIITTTTSLTNAVSYTWDITGTQRITVTAANALETVTETTTILVEAGLPPQPITAPQQLNLAVPPTARLATPITVTAALIPSDTTLPITYTWLADGQAPLITTTASLTNVVVYAWDITGTQRITVTAANAAGVVTATAVLTIEPDRPPVTPTATPTATATATALSLIHISEPTRH